MHLTSTGSNSWWSNYYNLVPNNDTIFNGQTYMIIERNINPNTPLCQQFAFRQVGNKLYGIVHDSLSEYLIMDFDAVVGDTIDSLYSEGLYYRALVEAKDSILVNNGIYHHYMNLKGLGYWSQSFGWQDIFWGIVWNERALCNFNFGNNWGGGNYGGVIFNVPSYFYYVSIQYASPNYCTVDPLYNTPPEVGCMNCIPWTNNVPTIDKSNKELIKMTDLMGRETEFKPNTPLINIYSDGTTEKVYRIE